MRRLPQHQIIRRRRDDASHVRGVLPNRKKTTRVQRAGNKRQCDAEMQIRPLRANRRGEIREVIDWHNVPSVSHHRADHQTNNRDDRPHQQQRADHAADSEMFEGEPRGRIGVIRVATQGRQHAKNRSDGVEHAAQVIGSFAQRFGGLFAYAASVVATVIAFY